MSAHHDADGPTTLHIIFLGVQPLQGAMLTYSELVQIDWSRIPAQPPVGYLVDMLLRAEGPASRAITQIQNHPGLDAYVIGTSDVPAATTTEYDQDQTNYRQLGRTTHALTDENCVISPAPNSTAISKFRQRKRLNDESYLFIIYLTESLLVSAVIWQ